MALLRGVLFHCCRLGGPGRCPFQPGPESLPIELAVAGTAASVFLPLASWQEPRCRCRNRHRSRIVDIDYDDDIDYDNDNDNDNDNDDDSDW
jgi:hypothetical protein